MKFQDLKKSLGNIKHAYLIRGGDAFLRQKAVEMITAHSLSYKELNLSVFTDENADISAIVSACKSIPMMDKRRVVVVRDILVKKADDLSLLLQYLKAPLDTTVLIIVDSLDNNAYRQIEPLCELVDCSPLDIVLLGKLVATQLSSYGIKINSDALETLVKYCNYDYTRINNEVIKLGNMLNSNEVITLDIVQKNVHREVEFDVFELGKAVSVKDGAKAMEIINQLLLKKESPQVLLMMILSNFRRMFYSISSKDSNANIASRLGVKEYAIKVAREVGSKFTPAQLKRILDLGASLDFQIKSGAMNEKNALLYFVSNVSAI